MSLHISPPSKGSTMPLPDMRLRLAALTLLPIALAGCDTAEPQTAAVQRAGENWILVEQGERAPQEKPAPAIAAEEDEELPEFEPVEPAEIKPVDPRCAGAHAPGDITTATVTPGTTTAAVTWYHPGDPTVTGYRVTASSQSLVSGAQPEIGWTGADPGEGCHEVTATVTGLKAGTPYVFTVDAVRKPTWQNGARTATVARSGAVVTNG
jgi:hypothetical protein